METLLVRLGSLPDTKEGPGFSRMLPWDPAACLPERPILETPGQGQEDGVCGRCPHFWGAAEAQGTSTQPSAINHTLPKLPASQGGAGSLCQLKGPFPSAEHELASGVGEILSNMGD